MREQRMKIYVNGVIIRETDLGENSKVVKILTAEKGIISAIAKQRSNLKSKNTAIVQLFAYCGFSLYVGKKGYIIDESEVLELFWGIREDLESLALAQYFCELCLFLSPEEHNSPDFLRLFLNSLYYLSRKKKEKQFLKAVYELRASSVCGYMPNLVGCHTCKVYKSSGMKFMIEKGNLICENCASAEESIKGYSLTLGLIDALRHIVYSPIKKIFSFDISEGTKVALFEVCEKYIYAHVGINFKSLNFYKSISRM